jgi:uncharacterized RmlC-like cupin family protein
MSQIERQSHWQDIGPQADLPGGDDTACRVTATPDARGRSHDLDRHTASSLFALSGSLRVQWGSTTLAQKIFTPDA